MAQSKCLLRFRARLRSRGYTDISIVRFYDHDGSMTYDFYGNPLWYVTCVEPLLGYHVVFTASEPMMDNWPGISFGEDHGYFVSQINLFDEDNIPEQIYEGGDGLFQ